MRLIWVEECSHKIPQRWTVSAHSLQLQLINVRTLELGWSRDTCSKTGESLGGGGEIGKRESFLPLYLGGEILGEQVDSFLMEVEHRKQLDEPVERRLDISTELASQV